MENYQQVENDDENEEADEDETGIINGQAQGTAPRRIRLKLLKRIGNAMKFKYSYSKGRGHIRRINKRKSRIELRK